MRTDFHSNCVIQIFHVKDFEEYWHNILKIILDSQKHFYFNNIYCSNSTKKREREEIIGNRNQHACVFAFCNCRLKISFTFNILN